MQKKPITQTKSPSFKFTTSAPIIMTAIGKGDLNEVKKLLNTNHNLISQMAECSNVALNPPVKCNISLLDLAAGLGKTEILSFLLTQKHTFKLENAFYFAAQNGHIESVEILLKEKIDITHENYKALRISVSKKHEKITQSIISNVNFDREKCCKVLDKNKDGALLALLQKPENKQQPEERKQLTSQKEAFIKACQDFDEKLIAKMLSDNDIVLAKQPEIFWTVWNHYDQWSPNNDKELIALFTIFLKQPSFKDMLPAIWHSAFKQQKILLCKLIASHIDNHTVILSDFVGFCKRRDHGFLDVLINNQIVNLKRDDNLALIAASLYLNEYSSDIRIINLLLEKGSNPCDQNYKAIAAAFCKGNFEIAAKLIYDKRVNLNDNDFELIFLLANSFNKSIYIETDNDKITIEEVFDNYTKTSKQEEFLEKVLNSGNISRKKLFDSACKKQNERIVSMMLKEKYISHKKYLSCSDYTYLINPVENYFEATLLVFKHFEDVSALNSIVSILKSNRHFPDENLFELICAAGNHEYYKTWISNNTNLKDITYSNLTEALCSASKFGHAQIVIELLKFSDIDPTADDNQAIRNAMEGNRVDIVWLLLNHSKCTLKTVQFALVTACKNGRLTIVSELIKFKDLDLTFDDNFLIRYAAKYGWDEIFRISFNNPFVDITAKNNEPIRVACEYNHINIVKSLLSKPAVDPTVENNICIYFACKNGNLEMVRLLLVERSTLIAKPNRDKNDTYALLEPLTQKLLIQYRVDPSADNNRALIVTCKNGYDEILVELLKDERVNPGDQKNAAFLNACTNNHPKVVKILLQYKGVVPFANDFEGIRIAYNKNHFEIIEIILNSDQMPVSLLGFSDHWLLQTACEKGHTAAVKTLLDKIQIIPDNAKQNSLLNALNGNHVQAFELLLKDGRFDPTFEGNKLIQIASKNNKPDFIKLLMDDGRADPTYNDYEAISEAYLKDYREVFEQLILHKNVDLTFNHNWLICEAAKKNDTELVMRLLQNPEVNPTDEQHCALKVAYIHHRNKDIFKQLLEDERSNVHFGNNWLLCEAAETNDRPLVERLLKSTEVKSADVCRALKGAYTNNHKEIYEILLNDNRMNPAFEDNWLLTEASSKNDIPLVERLLQEERVEQSPQIPAIEKAYEKGYLDIINIIIKNKDHAFLEKIFEIACDKNYVKIVKLLLEHPKFNPSFKDNFPIRLACEKGREEIVKLLLLHEKVDPSACQNEAIRIACKNGFLPIVEALLKEEKVNPADCNQEAICNAISNNHNPILSRLLLENHVNLHAFTSTQSTPFEDILNGDNAEIVRAKLLIVLKNIGLHFEWMSDKLKNKILDQLFSVRNSNLKDVRVLIAFKDGNVINTINSREELKNSWSKFNIQDLMLLYAGIQKPFWNMWFTGHCSTENAFLTRQIEEKVALSFASLFEEEKKKHDNSEQGIELAYQTILDYTEQLRSVNSNFYFDWLCTLGNDYLTVISTENSVTSYEDDAIDTFKVVYQEAAPFITTLELYIRSITTNPSLNNEQTPIAFNISKHCQCMLDKSIKFLEIAILGIVHAIQKKMKVTHNINTGLPEFNPETSLMFLREILNIFDKFTNIKNNSPLVLSCVKRILNPFFINHLTSSVKDSTRESFDKLSFLELISIFQNVQTTNISKQEEDAKSFTPLYQQIVQPVSKTTETSLHLETYATEQKNSKK